MEIPERSNHISLRHCCGAVLPAGACAREQGEAARRQRVTAIAVKADRKSSLSITIPPLEFSTLEEALKWPDDRTAPRGQHRNQDDKTWDQLDGNSAIGTRLLARQQPVLFAKKQYASVFETVKSKLDKLRIS
jgi:hypothetical protein